MRVGLSISITDAPVVISRLTKTWHETRNLYESRFGEIPEEFWPISNRCPNCGKRCKKKSDTFMDERPRLADLVLA